MQREGEQPGDSLAATPSSSSFSREAHAMDRSSMKYMNRKIYAWIMVLLILGPVGLSFFPGLDKLMRNLNVAVVVCMAMFTGARLADAGYRRWVGIAGVFLITVGLPIIAFLTALLAFRMRPPAVALPVGIGCMAVLLPFLIWAGTRPSNPDMNDRSDHPARNDRVDRIVRKSLGTFGTR